jgi:hypothetical protein
VIPNVRLLMDMGLSDRPPNVYPMATQARNTSATVQAWAIQPRGVIGASPSKISLPVPRPLLELDPTLIKSHPNYQNLLHYGSLTL